MVAKGGEMQRELSIRLSERHGVNPAIPRCFYCGGPKNEVILAGKLPGDAEAPHDAVWDTQPCDTCEGYMKQGVILVSVRDADDGKSNPYRTGGFVVVRAEAVARIFAQIMVDGATGAAVVLKRRFSYLPDAAWKALGLPVHEGGTK